MEKEERRRYVFDQLTSLPNTFQYVEVTKYIEDLESQLKKQKEINKKAIEYINKMFSIKFYNNDYCLGRIKKILEDKEV